MNEKQEQKEEFDGAYYHVYNRGSDKRVIFMDKKDYERFLECLRDFNHSKPTHIREMREARLGSQDPILVNTKIGSWGLASDRLVEIFCYCLMPNHFHLILKELVDGGIAKFMQKLCIGYTMYFNKRYERSGHLFQGKYKHKELDADFYLTYLTGYIHLNPVTAKLVRFPGQYKYSSYLDYLGKKKTDFLDFKPEELEIKIEDYEKFVKELKDNKEALQKVGEVSLGDD